MIFHHRVEQNFQATCIHALDGMWFSSSCCEVKPVAGVFPHWLDKLGAQPLGGNEGDNGAAGGAPVPDADEDDPFGDLDDDGMGEPPARPWAGACSDRLVGRQCVCPDQ